MSSQMHSAFKMLNFIRTLLILVAVVTAISANDLQVEEGDFNVTTYLNGVEQTGAVVGYLASSGSYDLELQVKLRVTWDCDPDFITHACTEDKPSVLKITAFYFDLLAISRDTGGTITSTKTVRSKISMYQDDLAYRGTFKDVFDDSHKTFTVALQNVSGFNSWAAQRYEAGDDIEFRVKIDVDPNDLFNTDGLVEETDVGGEANNVHETESIEFVPLTGALTFGDVTTNVMDVTSVKEDSAGCGGSAPTPNLRLYSDAIVWTPSGNGTWTDATVSTLPGHTCVDYVFNVNALDLIALDQETFGATSGEIGGLEVSVENSNLGAGGALPVGAVTLALPGNDTAHLTDATYGFKARGSRIVSMTAVAAVSDYADLVLKNEKAVYLHTGALPFMLHVNTSAMTLTDAQGIAGTFDAVSYLYDLNFDGNSDIRSMEINRAPSNDLFLSKVDETRLPLPFSMDAQGLDTSLFFKKGFGRSHFPRTTMSWEPFEATVENDGLGVGTVHVTRVIFNASATSTDCPGCDSATQAVTPYALEPTEEQMAGIGVDGALTASVTNPASPVWGPYDPASETYTFTRQNDIGAAAMLYYPGFDAIGSGGIRNRSVALYLLGMRAVVPADKSVIPDTPYLLSATESRRGNYYMAGLTVGPEIYSDADGQPAGSTLEGRQTEIAFGGPGIGDHAKVTDTPGVKYVVRPGGVTGVFNAVTNGEMSVPAYGYDLKLNKFAYRQVNNAMDDYNWMKGTVSVEGSKVSFDIAFDSLEFDCSARFGAMHIVREECDGIGDDVNCELYFDAWRAPIELLSLGFEPTEPEVSQCARSVRQLRMGNTFEIAALDKPLLMSAFWSKYGEPSDVEISGESTVVFDRPNVAEGSSQDKGFAMVIDRGVELKTPGNGSSDGWIEMNGTVGVPFWESLDVKARFANKAPDLPEQSIVFERGGSLTGSDDSKSNDDLVQSMESARTAKASDDPFKAHYRWGNSSLAFDMPIFYEPGRYTNSLAPRFVGRSLEYSMLVMSAKAGVDFIDRERTKLSFGASADLEKLRTLSIDLHVDVGDPESLRRVDGYLCSLYSFVGCGAGGPVSDVVGELTDELNVMNTYASSGIDRLLREGIETGFDEAVSALGHDPFDLAAKKIEALQALPQQAATKTSDALKELTEGVVGPLAGGLDEIALSVYQKLPQQLSAGVYTPDVNVSKNQLMNIQQALGAVDLELARVSSAVGSAKNEIAALRDDVAGWTGDVNDSINVIKGDVLDSLGDLQSGCSYAAVSVEQNRFVYQIRQLQNYSLRSVQVMKVIDLETFAYLIMAFTGVDLTGVISAQNDIKQLAAQLDETITDASTRLEGLCSEDYMTVYNEAEAYLDDIYERIETANTLIATVDTKLREDTGLGATPDGGYIGLLEGEINATREIIQAFDTQIGTLITEIDNMEAGMGGQYIGVAEQDIRDAMDNLIMGLSDDRYGWYDSGSGESFVVKAASDLREPIDEAIAQIALTVNAELGRLSSGAFHVDKEAMKAALVDRIMNTPLIDEVHRIAQLNLSELIERINGVAGIGFDHVNEVVRDALAAVNQRANELIQSATGEISGSLPLRSAGVDGYGLIKGNEIERLHIGAEWTMDGDAEENSVSYAAALDIINNNVNEGGGSGCPGAGGANSSFDAVISASGLPISLGASDAMISLLKLGFLIEGDLPKGIFGQISIDGTVSFEAFEMYGLNFGAGLGVRENYLGASGGAAFDDLQLEMAFLVGKTCSLDLLQSMDPQVADFITFPGGVFNGAYARGGASVPVYDSGCALEVGVTADVGTWFLVGPPLTFGGLVGGGAYGEALCIASLRGEVTAYGQKSGDKYTFGGEGFGVAGAGWDCDKHTWTSRKRSRKDSWCGTGDAGFKVIYDAGWDVKDLSKSSIH